MPVPFLIAPLLHLAAAAAPGLPPAPPLLEPAQLLADPEAYTGQVVRLHLSLQGRVEDFEGWLTRFRPARHRMALGWGDDQLPWVQDDYEHPRLRVFAARGGVADRVLLRARPHDRLVLNVIVREHLLDEPWIEVVRAVRTREHVPEGSVLHAIKAQELIDRGAFGMAVGELDRALAAPLPPHAGEVLRGARAACEAARGELASVRRGRATAVEAAVESSGEALRGVPADRR